MSRTCPKCGNLCEVSDANLELGSPVKCKCGTSFEILAEPAPTFSVRTPPPPPKEQPPPPTAPASTATPTPTKSRTSTSRDLASLLLVIAGMALAFVLWRWNWPKLMFVETLALTLFCWRQKRNWSKRDNKSPFYFLFDKSLEFLVPVCALLCPAGLPCK
jgi:hypothetical protein